MVESIEIDIPELLKMFAKETRRLLEEAEAEYEGGKAYYELCFTLCKHLVFVRMTCIKNGIPMPKWYLRDLESLRAMYAWHRDLKPNHKPKYILFPW